LFSPASCVIAAPTARISTLSLHDALPIYSEFDGRADQKRHDGAVQSVARHEQEPEPGRRHRDQELDHELGPQAPDGGVRRAQTRDRKSTRLNSSHVKISYAVFCLKKKRTQ